MVDFAPAPAMIDLSQYVEVRLMGNRPHVRGRRVPVALLAHSARSEGWGIQELAYQFTLSETEVLAALLYYQQHQPEVEGAEETEARLMEEQYKRYGRDS